MENNGKMMNDALICYFSCYFDSCSHTSLIFGEEKKCVYTYHHHLLLYNPSDRYKVLRKNGKEDFLVACRMHQLLYFIFSPKLKAILFSEMKREEDNPFVMFTHQSHYRKNEKER